MEAITGIAWMIIILCLCVLIISNNKTSEVSSSILFGYIKPMTDEDKFAKDCKTQTGLDLFDMSYIRKGGSKRQNMNGDILEECIQLSHHDKYGRLRKIESRTYKYDKDGECISQSAWNEQIPEYSLGMYKFENMYRGYNEWKNKEVEIN